MNTEKQQLSKEKPSFAFKNKQHFTQLPKISQTDEHIPSLEDEEDPQGIEKHETSIQITDIGKISLAQLLNRTDLNKLTHFSFNKLIGQVSIVLLANLLSQLTNLESLDLNIKYNQLDSTQVQELSLVFQAMTKLRSLKFTITELSINERNKTFITIDLITFLAPKTKTGFQAIYQAIGVFTQLQELELLIEQNRLSKIEMTTLSTSLQSLQFLTSLIFTVTNKTNQYTEIITLATSISKLILLEILQFSLKDAYISVSQSACLFECVQPLVNLKHLMIEIYTEVLPRKSILIMTKKFLYFKQLYSIKFTFRPFPFFRDFYEEGELYDVFPKLLKQSCLKNAKHLVHYDMKIID